MRVLFATAELAPVARVGGLAAAAAGLVKALRHEGVDVDLVLPDYAGLPLDDEVVESLEVPEWVGPTTVRRGVLAGVGPISLVEVPGMRRGHPYLEPDGTGYHDNDRRFYAFSAAVAALADERRPDVLHLNDWHTAGALAHVHRPVRSVLTIHTLGYQGQSNRGWLSVFGDHRDAYDVGGACNPLAGGIRLADLVIAVSPTYASEVVTPDGGFGLHHFLEAKGDRFVGILNGIDTGEWDPSTDPHLAAPFDASTPGAKAATKAALRAELGLADTDEPLAVVVTRLVHQKGIDLLLPSLEYLERLPVQVAVLGSGERPLVDALHAAAAEQPGRVAFRDGYDEGLAHRLFGGGDLFLMPSRFEPCGLAQMQSMRYGTLPVVTDVGGLHDTVIDVDADPKRATGVVTTSVDPLGVLDGLHRAVRAVRHTARRGAMQRRGMSIDWSWTEPARRHIDWYTKLNSEHPAQG